MAVRRCVSALILASAQAMQLESRSNPEVTAWTKGFMKCPPPLELGGTDCKDTLPFISTERASQRLSEKREKASTFPPPRCIAPDQKHFKEGDNVPALKSCFYGSIPRNTTGKRCAANLVTAKGEMMRGYVIQCGPGYDGIMAMHLAYRKMTVAFFGEKAMFYSYEGALQEDGKMAARVYFTEADIPCFDQDGDTANTPNLPTDQKGLKKLFACRQGKSCSNNLLLFGACNLCVGGKRADFVVGTKGYDSPIAVEEYNTNDSAAFCRQIQRDVTAGATDGLKFENVPQARRRAAARSHRFVRKILGMMAALVQ